MHAHNSSSITITTYFLRRGDPLKSGVWYCPSDLGHVCNGRKTLHDRLPHHAAVEVLWHDRLCNRRVYNCYLIFVEIFNRQPSKSVLVMHMGKTVKIAMTMGKQFPIDNLRHVVPTATLLRTSFDGRLRRHVMHWVYRSRSIRRYVKDDKVNGQAPTGPTSAFNR